MDDWAKQRMAELQAAAPVKRKKTEPFVKVPLGTAMKACTAMRCQGAAVWLWLVYRAWKTQSTTVAVPNGALTKLGINREAKRVALQRLEEAGLITVERLPKKTPTVTML